MIRLFVDIETLPCSDPADAPPVKAPSNYKDPEKIAAYIAEHAADAHRATALDPLAGRILCIGYAFDDAPPACLYGDDAVRELDRIVHDYRKNNRWSPVTWIGHNFAGFDLPYLYLHAARLGLARLCRSLPWMPHQRPYLIDTMYLAAGPGRERVSLDRIAKFFGLAGKSGMKGSEVYGAWLDGRHEEIAAYCMHDVELTREVFARLDLQNTTKEEDETK